MIKIGLTGSIGMGKTTAAAMFAELGAAVWSADDAVHRMYAPGGAAVAPVAAAFPEAVAGGAVDRAKLAALALGDRSLLRTLEAIVHPLVAADREWFITEAEAAGAPAAVFDIPLLFENRLENMFDAVVVVTVPPEIQHARVLARPGMTQEKLAAIIAEQMPDEEKRKRADYVVDTGAPIEDTRRTVETVFKEIGKQFGPRS